MSYDDSPGAASSLTALAYPTVGVATRNWLNAEAARLPWIKDLTDQWSLEMESQLQMVETGEPVFDSSATRTVNRWRRDNPRFGGYEYGHIRIPHGSYTDAPSYADRPLRFPLHEEIEAAGLTGWDWENKRSQWWGYDFDTITGHAAGVGITDEALAEVRRKASQLDYAEIRRSTGGGGLHLRIYNTAHNDVVTNHTMHAAGARAALQIMSKDVGFNFGSHVDVYGAILWIWHRKITEENRGLELIKPADPEAFQGLPENWQDHAEVIKGNRSKVQVRGVGNHDAFEALAAAREKVTIDETHKLSEQRITELGYSIVWNGDHNNWQTHTKAFQDLLEKYPEDYKGFYETLSEGTDPGKPNCFVFPLPGGAFKVVKYGQGATEHPTWTQNGSDWTWTIFNRLPSLRTIAIAKGGTEDSKENKYVFSTLEEATTVVNIMGGADIPRDGLQVLADMSSRQISLSSSPDGRIVVQIEKRNNDAKVDGWIKRRGSWERTLNVTANEDKVVDLYEFDNIIRGVVGMGGKFAEWKLHDNSGTWVENSKDNIKSVLRSLGHEPGTIEEILGRAIFNPWQAVNIPFAPEYPGERQWNRDSAQLAFQPAPIPGSHPTWDKVLKHHGQDLGQRITDDPWCQQHGVTQGADYLRLWIANMLRNPFGHIPYLFFFGPQNSGKSTFHEACSLLMTRGVVAGDTYLQGRDNFNAHIAPAILCVVEETNLGNNDKAYNRLKAIITSHTILINAKYKDQATVANATSWVQCANRASFCPTMEGDTRITSAFVPKPAVDIAKGKLLAQLGEEAPYFLRTIMDVRLPPPPGRLLLPPLGLSVQTDNYTEESGIQNFVNNFCEVGPEFRITTEFAYKSYVASCSGSFKPLKKEAFRAEMAAAGLILDPKDYDIRSPYEVAGDDFGKLRRCFRGFQLKQHGEQQ